MQKNKEKKNHDFNSLGAYGLYYYAGWDEKC